MQIGYTATEKFDPSHGERWQKYVRWSGLSQVNQIVSLDGLLCPNLVKELTQEDWKHNLFEKGMLFCFQNLEYVILRIGNNIAHYNILAVMKNPSTAINDIRINGFEFLGYDLIEKDGEISALTNCGGFENAFDNSELSEYGLITDYQRVCQINKFLYENNPSDPHACCDIWAIWRLQ